MKKPTFSKLELILFLVLNFALASYARGSVVFTHSFGFDTFLDSSDHTNPDVEVLDYQYGSSGQFGTHASREKIDRGEVRSRWQIRGSMPRGEFLYVKWRIKSSQEIREDKVDLKNRLPEDLTESEIHFAVRGRQLFVYFIPAPGGWNPRMSQRIPDYLARHQIYPDIPK